VLNGSRSVLRRRRRIAHEEHDLQTVSAETLALGREDQRSVLRALRTLPRRQRETLVLRYVFDLSEEETAEAMRVSRGGVKSNASRGRAALRRLLEEDA
jgi:RNA polymerase sigma factor (sigma-70 family)